MIQVEGLTKRYDRTVAVNAISFGVEKGQIVGFLGPNGAGKTTTMRILTCFMPPTEGTASVAGFDVQEQPQEVKRRIALGTFVLSSGYYDAYYTKAQKVRRLITDELEGILHTNDFIILPTTPGTAFKFGANAGDPVKMYWEDVFTVPASLAGLPAISVPVGQDADGLPFGLQIIGKKFDEAALLAFAHIIEKLR